MPCYVNLPLRWVHDQPAWIDWFVAGRMAPELGLDAASLQLPDSWHTAMAARLRDAGLACAVHLPFLGTDPCDLDAGKADASRDQLRRGAEIAAIYHAAHMIGHPYFRPVGEGREGRENDAATGRWMEASLAIWPQLPAMGDAPLFLENTYEKSPDAIAALVETLNRGKKPHEPVIGVCFDVGHWHAFAGCGSEEEFDPWLQAYAPFAMHLHLHDNDGSSDEHVGLGRGNIPFEALFAKLAERNKAVTATIEPHEVAAFTDSIAWFDVHIQAAQWVCWEKPLVEELPLEEIEKNLAK